MRVLIISDVHANLVALHTVLDTVGPVDEVWSLGDIVGYGPRPAECVDLIRDAAPNISIIGNHDWAAIGRLPLDDFNPTAKFASYWTRMQLNPDQLQYLESLPNRMIDRNWTVVHGSPRSPIWEYIYNAQIAAINFPMIDTRVCFVGHTHVQFHISETQANANTAPRQPDHGEVLDLSSDRFIINPGSVGQPRDGDSRAAYVVYEPEEMRVSFGRVAYDIAQTQEQMSEAGLPASLINRLTFGV